MKNVMKNKLVDTIDVAEYLTLVDLFNKKVDEWIDREKGYDNGENGRLHQIKMLDIKSIPTQEDENALKQIKRLFSDNLETRYISRLLDLDLELMYLFPIEFIENIKSKIIYKYKSYESLGLGSSKEWDALLEYYPFIWLVFIIQRRLIIKNV